MEDDTSAGKKRSSSESKNMAGSKKGKWGGISHGYHESTQVPNPSDTVYRILCPSKRIGGVIGKGGGIIKAFREDTKSRISVSDSVPGSDERVILIYSAPSKDSKESDEGNTEESMVPHCPAQDALMKVHDRMVEEELAGGSKSDPDNETELTARFLVPRNMVGCLLGKGGDVIQRLRTETGTNIRVLSADHLPPCALSTDELVQIQGNPTALRKAVFVVSTLLHQNPRKEKAINVGTPLQSAGLHRAGPPMNNMPLPHNSMYSPQNPYQYMPPPRAMHDYASHRGFLPGGFDDGSIRPGVEASGEFSVKILCLASKIGGIIGKGGSNVRQLQLETGAIIHVENESASSEERVIHVSAFETLQNPRSQTIDAILLLQSKASEVSEKGTVTTRLLVPSNKAGCLIGQGGSIISEMRKRTQADIRLYSKDEKPEYASADEELVQVSGSVAVAKNALGEILSRLRVRCVRDSSTAAEPPSRGQAQRGPPVSASVGVGTHGGYSSARGGMHDYDPPSYPVRPSISRYPNPNSSMEVNFPNRTIPGAGGIYSSTPETSAPAPGTLLKPQDSYMGRLEPVADPRNGSDHLNSAPSIPYNYSGQSNPQGSYPNLNGQGHNMAPQVPYQSSYQNPNQVPYHQSNSQQSAYSNMNAQHSAYPSVPAPGTCNISVKATSSHLLGVKNLGNVVVIL